MLERFITSVKDSFMYVTGILSTRYAYKGPHILQLNIINTCNMNCVGCFFHSFRKNDRFGEEWNQQRMKSEDFIMTIDQASQLRIRHIVLSGNGEPFMHPDILFFIKYIKKNKMNCAVVTNGTFINEETLKILCSLKLDSLILSLWDCNPHRYEELRPGHKQKLDIIKQWLAFYKNKNMLNPKIKVLYVLNNKNYNFVAEMYMFAKDNGIESIIFRLLKIHNDIARDFLLSQDQIACIIKQLENINRKDKKSIALESSDLYMVLRNSYIKDTLYKNDLFNNMPCYIGWLYMIRFPNGDVVPCCGCREYVLGNTYRNTLSEIWNSKTYQEFRYQALQHKNTEEFRYCHCQDISCLLYYINLKLNKYLGWFISNNLVKIVFKKFLKPR